MSTERSPERDVNVYRRALLFSTSYTTGNLHVFFCDMIEILNNIQDRASRVRDLDHIFQLKQPKDSVLKYSLNI